MPSDEAIPNKGVVFPDSALGHKLLDGLEGIEIGPGAHNPFGLNARSVGLSREIDPRDYDFFAQMQLEECGRVAPIDLPGDAADIPIADESTDFVVHSHVSHPAPGGAAPGPPRGTNTSSGRWLNSPGLLVSYAPASAD